MDQPREVRREARSGEAWRDRGVPGERGVVVPEHIVWHAGEQLENPVLGEQQPRSLYQVVIGREGGVSIATPCRLALRCNAVPELLGLRQQKWSKPRKRWVHSRAPALRHCSHTHRCLLISWLRLATIRRPAGTMLLATGQRASSVWA